MRPCLRPVVQPEHAFDDAGQGRRHVDGTAAAAVNAGIIGNATLIGIGIGVEGHTERVAAGRYRSGQDHAPLGRLSTISSPVA